MARILITGGRAPAALELARQFADSGHVVCAADSAPWMLCRASRGVAASFRVPEPKADPAAFADALRRIVEDQAIDLVIPSCEEVFYVGHFKDRLAGRARVFCPDLATLRALHSKWAFATSVSAQDGFGSAVRAPRSWLVQSAAEIEALPLGLDSLVLKPVYSRFAIATLIRPDAAAVAAADIRPERPWVAQEFIAGQEFCSYSVCDGGIVRAHVLYRPAWRAGKGAGIYFDPCERPEIARFVANLARHYGITGQLAFDFIEAPDGRLFVLECNPRATSGVHLFGGGLAEAFTGGGPALCQAEGAPRMVASAMMVLGPAQILRDDNPLAAARRFCWDFARARDVLLSWRDPLPACYALLGAAAFAWKGFRHRVSAEAATTLDIEWNGGLIA